MCLGECVRGCGNDFVSKWLINKKFFFLVLRFLIWPFLNRERIGRVRERWKKKKICQTLKLVVVSVNGCGRVCGSVWEWFWVEMTEKEKIFFFHEFDLVWYVCVLVQNWEWEKNIFFKKDWKHLNLFFWVWGNVREGMEVKKERKKKNWEFF